MTPQFQGGRSGPSRGRSHKPASAAASPKSSEAIRPLDPTLTPPDITTFRHWELGEEIQVAIEAMGITLPSPIQRLAIGPVLAGKDVIAKAETGTGKTLAFGAPMMAKIDPQRASVLGLVMCPTRELAEQVQKVLSELGQPRGIEVALIVGGEPLEPQIKALKRGAQVVVGTPGRILDLYKQRFLSFPWTEFAILDEADVMFEFGFIDDVKEILSYTPEERQTLLFSATFPVELLKLARENTRDPAEVATAAGLKTVDNIEQSVIFLDDEDRTLALMRLIENSDPEDVFLVFCPRRTDVDKLIRRLERMPFGIKALHGGYDQAARFRVMAAFRTGEVKALIATDVASRGLDVKHVSTVVNYGSPHDITDYTHRIGRTGRAGRKGRAITLVGGIDRRKWTQIEREATWKIPEVDPPLRGERPRPRREETPVVVESPAAEVTRSVREAGPAREAGPVREERPRREAPPREARARTDGPREERPARARAEHAPRARTHGGRDESRTSTPRTDAPREHVGREERSWPRDEHSPVRPDAPFAREPVRQIEPRPDDPVDRRDRPLRQRVEPPRWPADDEAPPREEAPRRAAPRSPAPRGDVQRGDVQRGDAPRGEAQRGEAPRRAAPRGDAQRGDAQRGDAPRSDAPRGDAPRSDAPRSDAPRSDAPRGDAPRGDAPRGDAPRGDAPRGDAPRGDAPRGDAPRGDAPRSDAPRSAAQRTDSPRRGTPRSASSDAEAPRGRGPRFEAPRNEPTTPDANSRADAGRSEPRSDRPARRPASPARANTRDAAPPRVPFIAPEDAEPENDVRPRGPDSGRTRAPRSESAAPRAPLGRAPIAARRGDEAAPAREARRDETARRASPTRSVAEDEPRGAPAPRRATAPRRASAPRGDAPTRGEPARRADGGRSSAVTPRSDSAARSRDGARAPAPRAADPRGTDAVRGDDAPRRAPAPRSTAAPRGEPAPRSRSEVPPPAPRPLAPRRRIEPGQVDPGEVRPIQSRRREPRPGREI